MTARRRASLDGPMRASVAAVLAALVVACSAAQPRAPRIAASRERSAHERRPRRPRPSEHVSSEAPRVRAELPHSCADPVGRCVPPADFVVALCQKRYPAVALAMFEKSAPWQHVFVKVADVAPINVLGGPSGDARLVFLEEVVILRRREIHYEGMEVEVPDAYDVLRLDGTCASLARDEFMWKRPVVRPKYAPVVWRQLDAGMREVLAQNGPVEQAREEQHQACRGSFLAGGGLACKQATQKLAQAIMALLGQGVTLPVPNDLPEWSPPAPMGAQAKRSDP